MNTITLSLVYLLGSSWCPVFSAAFVPVSTRNGSVDGRQHSALSAVSKDGMTNLATRRDFWNRAAGTASVALLSLDPLPAQAKASQETQDKEKIVKGYQRLSYLLDNWEKETTSCKKGQAFDTGCERTPEIVMEVSFVV